MSEAFQEIIIRVSAAGSVVVSKSGDGKPSCTPRMLSPQQLQFVPGAERPRELTCFLFCPKRNCDSSLNTKPQKTRCNFRVKQASSPRSEHLSVQGISRVTVATLCWLLAVLLLAVKFRCRSTVAGTMATAAAEYVLPEKYTDDLKDENGNPMSKRCAIQSCCEQLTR